MNFEQVLQQFFMGIGVEWVLWLLMALSGISVALIVERWLFYRRRRVPSEAVVALSHGQETAVHKNAMERRVSEHVGELSGKGYDREDLNNSIEVELRKQRDRYDRGLTFLATLGNNAPFIGLLGTVLGIMEAFYQLADITETTKKNDLIMTSISEALIATAMGLIVAIPAVMAYNVFRKRVNAATEQAREIANHRMLHLNGGDHGRADG